MRFYWNPQTKGKSATHVGEVLSQHEHLIALAAGVFLREVSIPIFVKLASMKNPPIPAIGPVDDTWEN